VLFLGGGRRRRVGFIFGGMGCESLSAWQMGFGILISLVIRSILGHRRKTVPLHELEADVQRLLVE
jgi:hypothetical protein